MTAPCWAIHDGAAGNRRQALALAQALAPDWREWALAATAAARWLAPRRFPGAGAAFGPAFADALRLTAPTLAIGCGRLAGLATRQARAAGSRVVQILDPRVSPTHWDLVIAPEHDRLFGANVISVLGSLNPVDDAWLRQARADFPQLAQLAGPLTAVLLGGPTRATRFDHRALETMLAKLDAWLAREGGHLLVCGSSRTPPAWAGLLRARYRDAGHLVWMADGDGRNPYAAALAWADRIVVSPDSVNMISEACATAAPVFIAEPDRASGRVGRYLHSLQQRDRVRALEREPATFTVAPVRETPRVAALVRARLSLD